LIKQKLICENICRIYLEFIFQKPFIKIRPKYLKPKDYRVPLELDGYCEELGIAFEHQGPQHYGKIKKFLNKFKRLQENDRIKKQLAEDVGIKIIYIPSLFDMTNFDDLHTYIKNTLKDLNIKYDELRALPAKSVIDLEKIEYFEEDCKYNILKNIIEEKGGRCLSGIFYSDKGRRKIKVECSHGHIWNAECSSIILKSWCKVCLNLAKHTLDDYIKLVNNNGGKCLAIDEDIKNNKNKVKWKCKENHIWEMSYDSVNRGRWCPICALKNRKEKRKIKLEDYKKVAQILGGKCLAKEEDIKNVKTKVMWECKEGHQWLAVYTHIREGHWCRKCHSNTIRKINR